MCDCGTRNITTLLSSFALSVSLRTEEEEERDKRRYKKQARNFKKKYQILASLKE